MSSAAQRTHSGAVSITETGAAGSEVIDPHHSPLFTRQELVRAARSGGHLEGEGGKGRERGVGRRGWGGGREEEGEGEGEGEGGRGEGEGVGGWIGYTLMYIYNIYATVCEKTMNHNCLSCEPLHRLTKSPTVQDAFRPIPGLISCARATGKVHFTCTRTCHAHMLMYRYIQINYYTCMVIP